MKRIPCFLLALLFFMSCKSETQPREIIKVDYPETPKVEHTDTYFDEKVSDPYRWLEDDRSPETEAWVKIQNATTGTFLDNIPYRDELKERPFKIMELRKSRLRPFIEGDYTYFRKNDGLQNQFVMYRYKNDADPSSAEVFLDPNTFKEDGTISLGGISFF